MNIIQMPKRKEEKDMENKPTNGFYTASLRSINSTLQLFNKIGTKI